MDPPSGLDCPIDAPMENDGNRWKSMEIECNLPAREEEGTEPTPIARLLKSDSLNRVNASRTNIVNIKGV